MSPLVRPPLRSRLLALCLGLFFALQPGARAGACEVRSLLAGLRGSECCCAAMRALEGPERPSCCSRRTTGSPERAPITRGGSCGCEVRAPAPDDALPQSPNASAADSAARWISAGARPSPSVTSFLSVATPDSSSDPSLVREASCERGPPCPDVVARSCARGVNGLLAVLGVALL